MGLKDDDAHDACPESEGGLEQEKLQLERDLNQAIADVQRYAARAAEAEEERDAAQAERSSLLRRVRELEEASRIACEAWERVPVSSNQIRGAMKVLRKVVDACLPPDQTGGEGGS